MKLHVHVHDAAGAMIGGELERKRKKSAKPLWSKADLEDLISRLVGTTGDEGPGHAFHGNQYVQVAGQNVEVPKTGSVKEKLHHLFAQGHKFTLKELAALLGQSEVTLRGRLSEIKKAAPAGGLILEKVGEHYSIKKKEIDPADEPDQNAWAKAVAEAENKATSSYEEVAAPVPPPAPVAAPPAPPEPIVEPEPKQTLAEKTLPDPHTFDPPADGPMDKAKADVLYKAKLENWVGNVQNAPWPKDIEPETITALATGWKNTKANAMAEWKANTSGVAQKAKDLGVFKADEQLVKDVIAGAQLDTALASWKTNTAKEKAGTWPPDPEKEALAALAKANAEAAAKKAGEEYAAAQAAEKVAEAEALAHAFKEHVPHFNTVPHYVPDTHVGITKDDFLDDTFRKEIVALNVQLFGSAGSSDSKGNKIDVEKELTVRLQASKSFQALVHQRGSKHQYTLPRQLIAAWAGSSGDHQPVSVAAQLAIRDAFAMNQADIATDALHLITKSQHSDDEVYKQAASTLGCSYSTPENKATFRNGMRDFVLAQYHNTQDRFKDLGVKHVYVARGSGGDVGVLKDSAATTGKIKLQPASSFSTNFSTAHGFSKGDSVYMVKVPVEQVLGSARTGYGCTGEHEVVVLAHPKTQAVRVPYSKSSSLNIAIDHVKATLASGGSEAALQKYEAAKAAKHAAEQKQAAIEGVVGKAPMSPSTGGTKKAFTSPALAAAKKGDVEATKQVVEQWNEFKSKSTGNFYKTTPFMASIVGHAEKVAAYKKEVALAKTMAKLNDKAQKSANKSFAGTKKPTVHVHVHAAATPQQKAAAHLSAMGMPTSSKVPDWYAQHPMHNAAKYHQMVAAGKTPIQIKHYYGSLKHAALKKLPGPHP